jgi:O-antigen/teichoic acid export membrane protein
MTGIATTKTQSPLRQFVSGIAWTMAATGAERGVALVQTFIIARLLGIETYGRYGLLFVTVGLVSSVAGLQLGLTATVHISRSRISEPSRAAAVVRLCEIVSATMALMAFGVIWFFPSLFAAALAGDHGYSNVLLLAGIMAVASVVAGVQDSVLQGFEQFNTLAIIKVTTAAVGLALVLMLGREGDLASVLLALTSGSIIRLAAVLAMKELRMRRAGAYAGLSAIWAVREVLWSFSLPSVLATLIGGLANWYGLVLVTKLPSGMADVAILTSGQQWRGMVLFATGVLSSVAIPMMARMSQSGDREGVVKIHRLNIAANMIFGVAVVAAVGIASGPILAAYGKGFDGGRLVFWLMVASAVPMSYLNVLLQYLVSHGRMWMQLVQYCVTNAVLLISYEVSIAAWGGLGFATATLVVSIISALALDRWLRAELSVGAAAECSSVGV